MIDVRTLPTEEMIHTARNSSIEMANVLIRGEYVQRLRQVKGKKIHLVNIYDYTTPPLNFQYIDDYVLREGVSETGDETGNC